MLAQIREGLDAIAVFEKAVAILAQEAGAAPADSEVGAAGQRPFVHGACRSSGSMRAASECPAPKLAVCQERAGLVRQLSSAYCAMVEIYLTDCWYAPFPRARLRIRVGLTRPPSGHVGRRARARTQLRRRRGAAVRDVPERGTTLGSDEPRDLPVARLRPPEPAATRGSDSEHGPERGAVATGA